MVLTGPITLQESEVELNVAAASALLAPGTGESTLISQASCWILSASQVKFVKQCYQLPTKILTENVAAYTSRSASVSNFNDDF